MRQWLRTPAMPARPWSASCRSYLPHGLSPAAVKPEIDKATVEFRDCVGRLVGSRYPPVNILLLVLERGDVVDRDHLAFQADHLADLDNAPLAVPHAFDLHNEIECCDDLGPDRLRRQIDLTHLNHVFDA